jgi:hypothetical protein
MTVEVIGPILLGVAAVGLVLFGIVWQFGRSDVILQRWAERHGYRLIDQQYCWFSKGPFFWTTSKGQTVYYVTVEDGPGNRRRGWVRCGGWFLGLFSDHADVRWDD